MKRMRVLFGQRRVMVLVTLTVLVLAAAALIASSASFTAQSVNAGNIFTAGSLTITNDHTAILAPGAMRPGDSLPSTVVISNTGNIPGQFTLTKSAVTGSAALAAKLDLTIQEVDGTGANVGAAKYTGKLNGAISGLALGTWSGTTGTPAVSGLGATHRYKFTVAWPNSPRDDAGDTALMTAACTCSFTWDATADSGIN